MSKIVSSTCLAAIRDEDGCLWFASDRRISWGNTLYQTTVKPKVVYREGMMLMGTGRAAVISHILYGMRFPSRKKAENNLDYMLHWFMPTLKNYLLDTQIIDDKLNLISGTNASTSIVLGIDRDLFILDIDDRDIMFDQIEAPYTAGCGGPYAMGSLLTTESLELPTDKRLILALQVAAKVSAGCDDNIDVVTNRDDVLKAEAKLLKKQEGLAKKHNAAKRRSE